MKLFELVLRLYGILKKNYLKGKAEWLHGISFACTTMTVQLHWPLLKEITWPCITDQGRTLSGENDDKTLLPKAHKKYIIVMSERKNQLGGRNSFMIGKIVEGKYHQFV